VGPAKCGLYGPELVRGRGVSSRPPRGSAGIVGAGRSKVTGAAAGFALTRSVSGRHRELGSDDVQPCRVSVGGCFGRPSRSRCGDHALRSTRGLQPTRDLMDGVPFCPHPLTSRSQATPVHRYPAHWSSSAGSQPLTDLLGGASASRSTRPAASRRPPRRCAVEDRRPRAGCPSSGHVDTRSSRTHWARPARVNPVASAIPTQSGRGWRSWLGQHRPSTWQRSRQPLTARTVPCRWSDRLVDHPVHTISPGSARPSRSASRSPLAGRGGGGNTPPLTTGRPAVIAGWTSLRPPPRGRGPCLRPAHLDAACWMRGCRLSPLAGCLISFGAR